jgi:hypothetical protein
MKMTTKTALKWTSKMPMGGTYQKSRCIKIKRLLNAIKRVFFGGWQSMKTHHKEV